MIGYSFQPDSEKRLRGSINAGNGQLGPQANEALKILSLKLPDVLSGRPIAPDDLLRPQVGGAGGRFGDAVGSVQRAVTAGTTGAPVVPRGPTSASPAPPSQAFSALQPPAAQSTGPSETQRFTNTVNSAVNAPTQGVNFGFSTNNPNPAPAAPQGSGIEALLKTLGFRQFDPGVYTNDAAYGQGRGFVADPTSGSGYREDSFSHIFGR